MSNLQHFEGEWYYLSVGLDEHGIPTVVMRVKCLEDEPMLTAQPEGHNCNADYKLVQGRGGSELMDGNYDQ